MRARDVGPRPAPVERPLPLRPRSGLARGRGGEAGESAGGYHNATGLDDDRRAAAASRPHHRVGRRPDQHQRRRGRVGVGRRPGGGGESSVRSQCPTPASIPPATEPARGQTAARFWRRETASRPGGGPIGALCGSHPLIGAAHTAPWALAPGSTNIRGLDPRRAQQPWPGTLPPGARHPIWIRGPSPGPTVKL